MSVDLSKIPFNLDTQDQRWVKETLAAMTIQEKIGQLFFLMAADGNKKELDEILSIQPGGVMYRPMKAEKVIKGHNYLQANSTLPLFLASNLECGSNGLAEEGSFVGHPMLISATNDPELAYKKGLVVMKEARDLGGNMAFAPILDINFNWENPIANIRCYGDDIERVSTMSQRFVDGIQQLGGAVTIKHFPGDGVDGRDQHVVKTINSLSFYDWKKSFGRVYQENIDNGATGLMVGHIALPSYFEERGFTDEDPLLPATLSKRLLNNLLREELGYNGLIITDATVMTGFGAEGKRKDLLPQTIINGCDMILFTKSITEDYQSVMDAYTDGRLTDERINEAVTRILALKKRMKLTISNSVVDEGNYKSFHHAETKQLAKEVADKGVTLVCDHQDMLPLTIKKHQKIGIISLGNEKSIWEILADSSGFATKLMLKMKSSAKKTHIKFGDKLKAQGFAVSYIDHSNAETLFKSIGQGVEEMKSEFDAIIYFVKKDTMSNQTTLRLSFKSLVGFDAPWFVKEIPTIMISVGNPYHQYDLEPIETVINAYSPTDAVIDSMVDKLLGKSEFKGISPVKLKFKPFTNNIDEWLKD